MNPYALEAQGPVYVVRCSFADEPELYVFPSFAMAQEYREQRNREHSEGQRESLPPCDAWYIDEQPVLGRRFLAETSAEHEYDPS